MRWPWLYSPLYPQEQSKPFKIRLEIDDSDEAIKQYKNYTIPVWVDFDFPYSLNPKSGEPAGHLMETEIAPTESDFTQVIKNFNKAHQTIFFTKQQWENYRLNILAHMSNIPITNKKIWTSPITLVIKTLDGNLIYSDENIQYFKKVNNDGTTEHIFKFDLLKYIQKVNTLF